MNDWLPSIVGSSTHTMLWWQMMIRAILIFLVTLVFVRFGGKRVFGKNTSFDIVLSVILGSNMSRALTGNAPFLPTIAASVAIVVLHMVLARVSFYNRAIGHLVKGNEDKLVASGNILWDKMKRNNITAHDLMEALRTRGIDRVERVEAAYIERGGQISVISMRS